MKKISAILLCVMLAAAITMPVMALKHGTANKAPGIVIDGIKDDAYGDSFIVDAVRDDTDPNGATAQVWTAWDDSNLYYYAEIYDKTPHFPGTDIAQNNSDSMTFFIDWNAGGVIANNDEGTPIDDGTTPWWEVRVYSGVNGDTGEWPVHGGWSIGNDASDGSAMDVSIDFREHPEIVEVFIGGINGDYSNGYIVEIRIKAPDNVTLTEGKVIPIELHVTDNILGEDMRDGRKYLVYHDNFSNAWCSPGNAGGRLTLGAAYAAPLAADDAAMGGGAEADAEISAVTASLPRSTRTGDAGITALAIAVTVAAAAGVAVFRRKAVK